MQMTLYYWIKEETVLRDMIDRLIKNGRFCRMDMNVKRAEVMKILNAALPGTDTDG
jgi:hypothetical protein